jgi:hypothetical protein
MTASTAATAAEAITARRGLMRNLERGTATSIVSLSLADIL